jgi:hypothetical protein
MNSDVVRIFVSSTWNDLQPERRIVEDAINRMSGAKFTSLEFFGSSTETAEHARLDEVDRADLYLGIIGGRYGSGVVEAEYRRARERDLPCIIYFKDEAGILAERREKDPGQARRLEAFKRELRADHVINKPFASPQELAIYVRDDLHRWFFDHRLSAQLTSTSAGSIAAARDDQRALRLEAGSEHGSIVHNGELPRPRPRTAQMRSSVRQFHGLLDRATESDAALIALQSLEPVEFYGQPGIGKTALLRHLAYHTPEGKFPDGVVYLDQVGRQPAADLQQILFDSFYESDSGYKPREAELRGMISNKHALVMMDDVELSTAEIERVMNAGPGCAFLLSSQERHMLGEGRALQLVGLPEKESLQLLEREMGRRLTAEEQAAAQYICSVLQGHPLHIAQTAALAVKQNRPLVKIAARLQSAQAQSQNPADIVNRQIAAACPDDEKRVLAVLAALDGAPVGAENLRAITGLADIEAAFRELLEHRLIEAHGNAYQLTGSLQVILQKDWDLTDWRRHALNYFAGWAEQHRLDRKRILEESAALLGILNWATQTGRHRMVMRLGRALESSLILSGRWEAWGQVLQQIGQAAEATGDRGTIGWVLHQQGTRALCLGNDAASRELLSDALEIRAEMGDHAAASATRHNLDWLLPRAPQPYRVPEVETERPAPPEPVYIQRPARSSSRWLKLGSAALLAGIVTWFFWPEAKAQFLPGRLEFNGQEVNKPSAPLLATLTNSLSKPLQISDIKITGAAASVFTIVENECLNTSLAAGEQCKLSIAFTPLSPGAHQAELEILDGGADKLAILPLAGAAVAAAPTPETSPTPDVATLLSVEPSPSPTAPPRIYYFVARPASITVGGVSSLCYLIGNAASASISPNIGELNNLSKSCIRIRPRQTTSYRLNVSGADNEVFTKSTTVVVRALPRYQPTPEERKKAEEIKKAKDKKAKKDREAREKLEEERAKKRKKSSSQDKP